jgi:Flp pilus assembly protein TadD
MSHTLSLVDDLLAVARKLHAAGRNGAALEMLQRLANFRNLAPAIAEQVHSLLADLYAAREQYKQARRHLAIAMTFRPQHADYHHRMGRWIEADPDAAIDRAGRYYRRAVRSEPNNAEYWADYGTYLLSAGRSGAGRRALYRAFRLSHGEPELVGRIALALRDDGHWDDARRLLRRAWFLHGRDRRFHALWQQQQFAELAQQQQARADAAVPRQRSGPQVLPLLRTHTAAPLHVEGRIIRFDAAAAARGVKLPRHRRLS